MASLAYADKGMPLRKNSFTIEQLHGLMIYCRMIEAWGMAEHLERVILSMK